MPKNKSMKPGKTVKMEKAPPTVNRANPNSVVMGKAVPNQADNELARLTKRNTSKEI